MVAGRDFELHSREIDGILLRMFTQTGTEGSLQPELGLDLAAGNLRAFEARFGPYPFIELDIVESPITIDGYEFSGLVIVDPGLRSGGSQADYEYILAHEIAHQWWYGLAGNRTVEEPWLDEAHASYAAILYLEHAGRPESAAQLLSRWENTVSRLSDPAPVDSSALEFENWNAYRDVVYLRGALFIHSLRQELGEEAFFRLLQRYQEEARYRIGSTELYLQLAEETAGRELDDFLQQWINGGRPGS